LDRSKHAFLQDGIYAVKQCWFVVDSDQESAESVVRLTEYIVAKKAKLGIDVALTLVGEEVGLVTVSSGQVWV
jgi:hypothetical protein